MLLVITVGLTSFLQTAFNVNLQADLHTLKQAGGQQVVMPYTANRREEMECAEATYFMPAFTENL